MWSQIFKTTLMRELASCNEDYILIFLSSQYQTLALVYAAGMNLQPHIQVTERAHFIFFNSLKFDSEQHPNNKLSRNPVSTSIGTSAPKSNIAAKLESFVWQGVRGKSKYQSSRKIMTAAEMQNPGSHGHHCLYVILRACELVPCMGT